MDTQNHALEKVTPQSYGILVDINLKFQSYVYVYCIYYVYIYMINVDSSLILGAIELEWLCFFSQLFLFRWMLSNRYCFVSYVFFWGENLPRYWDVLLVT